MVLFPLLVGAQKVYLGTTETGASLGTGTIEGLEVGVSLPDLPVIQLDSLRTFPSCFGAGCDVVVGGREGKIYYVDDLDGNDNTAGTYDSGTDSYSGTVLGAMEDSQAFNILFNVSGAIDAHTDPLDWFTDSAGGNDAQDDKTFIGASAPYPGIFIYGARWTIKGTTSPDNWVLRNLTILRGTDGAHTAGSAMAISHGNSITSDCTIGWGNDEGYGTGGGPHSVMRTLMTQGQQEGGEDKGGIMGGFTGAGNGNQSASAHNMAFFTQYRQFNMTAADTDLCEELNNVGRTYGARINSYGCGIRLNHINNIYTYKFNSGAALTNLQKWNASTSGNENCLEPDNIYTTGNLYRDANSTLLDNRDGLTDEKPAWTQHITGGGYTIDDQLPSSFFTTTKNTPGYGMDQIERTADDAFQYNIVERNVGSRYYTDSNGDRQYYLNTLFDDNLQDLEDKTDLSFISADANLVLSTLSLPSSGTAYTDTDKDGMSDNFEDDQGLDKNDHTDGKGKLPFYYFDNYTIDNRERNSSGTLTGSNIYYSREIYWEEISGGFQILLDYINDGLYD